MMCPPFAVLSPLVCLCWMVRPPSRGLVSPCLPSPFLSLCWMVCLPSRRFVSPCLPLSPHMRACVGWFIRHPEVLSPLVFHCPPSCFPVSPCLRLCAIVSHYLHIYPCPGWCVRMVSPPWITSAFKRPCLPLSPIVSPHVCLCWMVCPPSRGFGSLVSLLVSQLVFLLVSQLVSQLVFLLVSLCGGWSDFAFFFKQCTVRGS